VTIPKELRTKGEITIVGKGKHHSKKCAKENASLILVQLYE
jgi:hypothetical protein